VGKQDAKIAVVYDTLKPTKSPAKPQQQSVFCSKVCTKVAHLVGQDVKVRFWHGDCPARTAKRAEGALFTISTMQNEPLVCLRHKFPIPLTNFL